MADFVHDDVLRIVHAEQHGHDHGFVIEFFYDEPSRTWGLIDWPEPDLEGPFVSRREAEDAIELYMLTSDELLVISLEGEEK